MPYNHRLHCRMGVSWGWGGASVFLQTPKHSGRHALLLQPHLWGRGQHGHFAVFPKGLLPSPPPHWVACPSPLGSRSISSSSSSSPSSISSGLACWANSASSSRDASLLGRVGSQCSARPGHLSSLLSDHCPEDGPACSHPQPLVSPHEQDLVLGPCGLVMLSLGRQLLGPLLQQLHVIHATLPRGQVRHWWGSGGSHKVDAPSPHNKCRMTPTCSRGPSSRCFSGRETD